MVFTLSYTGAREQVASLGKDIPLGDTSLLIDSVAAKIARQNITAGTITTFDIMTQTPKHVLYTPGTGLAIGQLKSFTNNILSFIIGQQDAPTKNAQLVTFDVIHDKVISSVPYTFADRLCYDSDRICYDQLGMGEP